MKRRGEIINNYVHICVYIYYYYCYCYSLFIYLFIFFFPFFLSFSLAKSKGRYDGVVSAVAISPSGELFAASRDRFLCVGPTAESELSKPDLKLQENRLLHTAKITSLDFSPDNTHLLSGGIDCQVFIWDADNQDKFDRILNVHAPLGITQVKYVDNERFLTAGSDGVIRLWGK